jgi:hypothetical protein
VARFSSPPVLITASDVKAIVIRRAATFSAFTPENDLHGEHDFGSLEVDGRRFFFQDRRI